MKKILLSFIIIAAGFAAAAQDLAPDQNPNYKVSMDKYTASQVSLQTTMNTTVQDTYKAYDWSTAKAERKAENRRYRREYYNNGYYNNGYYNGGYNNSYYNNGYYNPYGSGYNRYNPYYSPSSRYRSNSYYGWRRHR